MHYFESASRTNVKGMLVVTSITIEPREVNSAGEHRFTMKGLRGTKDATLLVKSDTEHAVKAWVDFIKVSLLHDILQVWTYGPTVLTQCTSSHTSNDRSRLY
jgi:hypothetical protein